MRKVFIQFQTTLARYVSEEGQYIKRTTPKPPKDSYTLQEKAQDMKQIFGEEYKSPFEKYDLHLPRTEVPGGPMPQYERLNRKDNFRRIRILMGIGAFGAVAFAIIEYAAKRNRWNESEEHVKLQLAETELRRATMIKAKEIFNERKKETQKIIEKAKNP